ncbi:MAG TPA: hypothetical protein VFW64_00350 [Pseudonocardiaceae bacterium]|nr:hypothetical protein [Pseudonocardiaceae bacterium]
MHELLGGSARTGAAYDHLAAWQRQHECNGGTVVVDEVGPARHNGDGGNQ